MRKLLWRVQGGAWLSPKLQTTHQQSLDRQTTHADGVSQECCSGPTIITGAAAHRLATVLLPNSFRLAFLPCACSRL